MAGGDASFADGSSAEQLLLGALQREGKKRISGIFHKRPPLHSERIRIAICDNGRGIDSENASAKITQYERGVHIPKFPRLKDLADALQVPTAYFYAESEELAELLYAYEGLSRKDRQKIRPAGNAA